mmetsp:Transcript_5245/g.11625  ORF Transcript_5245/g.11625 Transcript_5245/m.11625 type:complete len:384 (-) Transcript_5245:1460-2611(-)
MILQLNRSIYGLKTSSKRWKQLLIDDYLVGGYHLRQLENNPCILMGKGLMILVHVDDCLILGTTANIVQLTKYLKTVLKFTLESATKFLGMEINITKENIIVKQKQYAEEILKYFRMQDSKPKSTPITPGTLLPTITAADHNTQIVATNNDKDPYLIGLGKLNYMLMTKPEISYAIHALARHNKHHDERHWTVMKQVVRYLQGVKDEGLTYRGGTENRLIGYTDASFATCETSKRSTSGRILFLDNNIISFKTKRQPIVSMSSCEAEMIAINALANDIMEMRKILDEMGFIKMPTSIIYTDSQSAISLILNQKPNHARSKHINLRKYRIRELIREGSIEIRFISGEENMADIFTKNTGRNIFERLKAKLYASNPHEGSETKST